MRVQGYAAKTIAVTGVIVALVSASGGAAVGASAGPGARTDAVRAIVLPGATSAEGVAIGRGSTFYASELYGGDIFRGDVVHGTVERLVDAPAGQMAGGLKVDDRTGLLFVAGGFGGNATVYDSATGRVVAAYQLAPPGQSLINDVVITRTGAWFTDSMRPVLYFIPISPGGRLGPARTLTVTGPAASTAGTVNLNGIDAVPDGRTLIVGNSSAQALYTVNPATGASALLANVAGPDGLALVAGRLWVAQPFLNQVTQLRVDPRLGGAVVERVITNPLFQTPTTVAVFGHRLLVVNAKFDTGFPPTADQYEVLVLPLWSMAGHGRAGR